MIQAIRQDRDAGRLPWMVVASAGTTNTGVVDPLAELAGIREQERIWLHIDAAYGWPACLTDEGRVLLRGIERADSITLDPHKWFGQTFEAGGLLIRDGNLLGETFALRPEYMQDVEPDGDQINFADHGIALTRRFRALKIWFSIKVLGVRWFRDLVRHCQQLAEYAEALVKQAGCFEVLSTRHLSIVCFRYVPANRAGWDEPAIDALNLAICDAVRESGIAFFSTTRLRERVSLRLCFVNWRTTAADVEEIIRLIIDSATRRPLLHQPDA